MCVCCIIFLSVWMSNATLNYASVLFTSHTPFVGVKPKRLMEHISLEERLSPSIFLRGSLFLTVSSNANANDLYYRSTNKQLDSLLLSLLLYAHWFLYRKKKKQNVILKVRNCQQFVTDWCRLHQKLSTVINHSVWCTCKIDLTSKMQTSCVMFSHEIVIC